MWYYAWTKATIPKCSESVSERFGRIYVVLCLVWLPLRPYLSPTACCQPASASPLQISSTGIPSSLAFWSARILAVRELYLPASAPCSAPSQICHSLQLFTAAASYSRVPSAAGLRPRPMSTQWCKRLDRRSKNWPESLYHSWIYCQDKLTHVSCGSCFVTCTS